MIIKRLKVPITVTSNAAAKGEWSINFASLFKNLADSLFISCGFKAKELPLLKLKIRHEI